MHFRVGSLALGLLLASLVAGCTTKTTETEEWSPPGVGGEKDGFVVTPPQLPTAASPNAGGARVGDNGKIILPGGGEVKTVLVDNKRYVPVEMTFSERSWQSIQGTAGHSGKSEQERTQAVREEMKSVLGKIAKTTKIVNVRMEVSVGWATALVPIESYESIATIQNVGRRLLVNPVVSTPLEHVERMLHSDEEMGFAANAAATSLEDLIGISRMGIKEFIADAQADLGGYAPNGSHVRIGITDTGITYNHPAFTDVNGKPRIDSMRDFSGEGRIFFTAPDRGRFSIAAPAAGAPPEALVITADYLLAPPGNDEDPDPSALQKIENEQILVGPELKALLTSPGASGARFGMFDEAAFGKIDLDHNGSTTDKFYAILVPGRDDAPDAVWVAIGGANGANGGRGDFRKSPRLTNFDLAHETQSSFAEKFGFEIKHEKLTDASGADVAVTTAAIVGFDPGAHGSHVAGIAAARKMIANHPDDTDVHGVAPLARLASGRICANTGGCRATQAIIELSNAGADVINMSIGSLSPANDGYDVQEAVIDRLTVQNNTVFVIAASNDGPGHQTVGSPSVARYGIAVGATASPGIVQAQYHYPGSGKVPGADATADDFMLYFSSRGPTAAGGMKPDISAPGTWLSAVQLNAAPGDSSGLDVMWGTSMASPAMTGSVALLLDAAKVYNTQHSDATLSTDARTIRRILLASARPFDVTTLDTHTGETKKGQYTWVDEGFGMVNLQHAWKMLKEEKQTRLAAPVSFRDESNTKFDVPLDYQVRVLRTNPNGGVYDGTQTATEEGDALEAKYGRGLWIDAKNNDTMFKAQIARRLPTSVVDRPDVGDLAAMLETTADEFELETTIHGSTLNWLRAGGSAGIDCTDGTATSVVDPSAPLQHLVVAGEGANDQPINPTTHAGGSVSQETSTLYVCVNRALVAMLPSGDNGAVVSAYRIANGKRENSPSWVLPVYVTVPEKVMAAQAGLHVSSTVGSFGVGRHYVDVPKGTTVLKVKLEVPPAVVAGTTTTGCSGVILEALEGGNTNKVPEFEKNPSDSVAQSCGTNGRPAPSDDWRTITINRSNPKPGIWDLHVFGLYTFINSAYTLDVEFAKVTATKAAIDGAPAALSTTFDVDVADASYALALSADKSTFVLGDYIQDTNAAIHQDEKLRVPNNAGELARVYGADVGTVTIATGNSAGNDIDLNIWECDDHGLTQCTAVGQSGTPTDVETATFTPKAGKFYFAEVVGYGVPAGTATFDLHETLHTANPEKGTLQIAQTGPQKFAVTTAFPADASQMVNDPRYTSGAYHLGGLIQVNDDTGTVIVTVPLNIHP